MIDKATPSDRGNVVAFDTRSRANRVTLRGISGHAYQFKVHDLEASLAQYAGLGGLFIVAGFHADGEWRSIAIGHTADLSNAVPDAAQMASAREQDAQHILVRRVADTGIREAECADLRALHDPPVTVNPL